MKFLLLALSLLMTLDLWSARLKDISSIRGVRENQLIGYGLVVGLKGTGDGKIDYTNKSLERMLNKLGMKMSGSNAQSKNVAAVLVTAKMPPFAKAGNYLDVTVHSIGDAASLEGGTLVQTPLRAGNEEIYAVAQGALVIGVNEEGEAHTTSARVPNGSIIERDMSQDFSQRKMFRITLYNPDFTTAARTALSINNELGGHYATAKDGGTIDLIVPFANQGKGV